MNKDYKIIVAGKGGQGIKLLMTVLAKILSEKFNVSLYYNYDSAIRGGKIFGFLTFSKEKIGDPLILNGDYLVNLIVEDVKYMGKEEFDLEKFDVFAEAEEKFKTNKVANMMLLGYILKKIEIEIDKGLLDKVLPEKFKDMNIEAINYGFNR